MKPKQKKCLELMVFSDCTQKEIAEAINVSEKTICEWKKDNEFMTELNDMMHASFKTAAPQAFRTIAKLLLSNNDFVRLYAARDILDRAGYKPGEKRDKNNVENTTAQILALANLINNPQGERVLEDD